MKRTKIIIGQRFHKLIIAKEASPDSRSNKRWLCKCDCGNEKIVYDISLKNGDTKSCGCLKKQNLIGKKFFHLTILKKLSPDKNKNMLWLCRCDCGNKKAIAGSRVKTGRTKSCGCLIQELAKKATITHNCSSRRSVGYQTYRTWCGIKMRCLNKNNSFYAYYGGRGIKMCRCWQKSFENFLADMKMRPSGKYSIDRKDNDGHYSCGHCTECKRNGWTANCRWATASEQNLNRRPRLK